MKHRGYNEIVNAEQEHKWRYSNKEFEGDFDLNLYDSKARMYDQVTGRFTSIDPHATSYSSHSTYNYAFSNPILYGDPTGKDNMIYVLLDKDMTRAEGQGVVDKANEFFKRLGVNTRAMLFNPGLGPLSETFDPENLANTDNWVIIGKTRQGTYDMVKELSSGYAKDLDYGEWTTDMRTLEIANKNGARGFGVVIDYATGLPTKYSNNVEASAIALIHGDTHTTPYKFKLRGGAAGEGHSIGPDGLMTEGGNYTEPGTLVYNIEIGGGYDLLLKKEHNDDFFKGNKGRHGVSPAKDNYYFNKAYRQAYGERFGQIALRLGSKYLAKILFPAPKVVYNW